MTRTVLSFLFIAIVLSLKAQVHPLSKSDSGIVIKSLEKYEYLLEENDLRGASGALNDAAFVYWNNNHYQQAADYYEKSLELNEQVANENGIAMLNNNLGMLNADLGNYEKSLDHFTRTLAARRANKEEVGMVSALVNMSVVLNRLDRYDESIKALEEALDLSRERYDINQMRSVYGMLSETYEKMGDAEKSLYYFEYYKAMNKEVQGEEVKETKKQLVQERIEKELIATQKENELLKKQLEIKRQEEEIQKKDSINQSLYSNLSRKEVEIQLLEKSKQVSELEAKAQQEANQKLKYFRNSLIVVAGALFVITILILINVRKTKKHRDELADKNVRIENQRQELETANHTKDRIFSIISHDLRSPIKSLQGFFTYIDVFDIPDDLKSALSGMESELVNSASLLDNLLAWSKSQIQKHDPEITEFNIKPIVDETIQLLQTAAEKKKIKLVANVTEEDILVTDPQMLKIAIRNLLQNAIKFTPIGGEVALLYVADDQGTYVKVKDSGIGMSFQKMQSLFDIKTNRSSEGTAKEKGSGLGLILTKELVEQAGGEINVESTVGHGTEFSIQFSKVQKTQLV